MPPRSAKGLGRATGSASPSCPSTLWLARWYRCDQTVTTPFVSMARTSIHSSMPGMEMIPVLRREASPSQVTSDAV
ncbi:MAG: hypothetical protein F4123_11475 [Gemmatimonadetes bacterium]|nr:hypothetical protein [Gemmatimonadota bacterium]MYK66281.1 hypothetical protein [Gemmatimonadota bacterium]